MSVSLGTLMLNLELSTELYEAQIHRARMLAIEAGRDIERSLRVVGEHSLHLRPTVDDSALTKLNQHLELKKAHFNQIQQYFNLNPLTPKVDTSNLDELENTLDRLAQKQRSISESTGGVGRINPIERSYRIQVNSNKLEEDIVSSIQRGFKKASSGGINLLGGLAFTPFKLLSSVLSTVSRGALEGIGQQISKDLGDGIAVGISKEIAPLIGSFKLLGRELAQALTHDFIQALGSDVDLIKPVLEQIIGKDKILIESGAIKGQIKQEEARKTNEASRYYASERTSERIQEIKTLRNKIEQDARDIDSINNALRQKIAGVQSRIESVRGFKPGQLEKQAEAFREELNEIFQSIAGLTSSIQSESVEIEGLKKRFSATQREIEVLQKFGMPVDAQKSQLVQIQQEIESKESSVKIKQSELGSQSSRAASISNKLENTIQTINSIRESAEAAFQKEFEQLKKIEETHQENLRKYESLMVPFDAATIIGDVVAPSQIAGEVQQKKAAIKSFRQKQQQLKQSLNANKQAIDRAQEILAEEFELPEEWRDETKIKNTQLLIEKIKKEQYQRVELFKAYERQIQQETTQIESLQLQETLPQAKAASANMLKNAIAELESTLEEAQREGELAAKAGNQALVERFNAISENARISIQLFKEKLGALEWEELPSAGGIQRRDAIADSAQQLKKSRIVRSPNPDIVNQILEKVAERSGIDIGDKPIPRLVLDQTLSEGTGAEYSFKDNFIRVPKDLWERIQRRELSKTDFASLIHESRHAVQYDFGQLSSKEAARREFLLSPTVQEAKQFGHRIESSVEHQPAGAKRIARKLEKDAYTFDFRETEAIMEEVTQALSRENFESRFGVGGGKARLDLSRIKKTILNKLEPAIANASVDISEDFEAFVQGLENLQKSIEPILDEASNVNLPGSELAELGEDLAIEIKEIEKAMYEMAIQFKTAIANKPDIIRNQIREDLKQFSKNKLSQEFGVSGKGINKKQLIENIIESYDLRELHPKVQQLTRAKAQRQLLRQERLQDIAFKAGEVARIASGRAQSAIGLIGDLAQSPQVAGLLQAADKASKPILAVAKAGYRLVQGMEDLTLDLMPMGRSVKGVLQQTAIPALMFGGAAAFLPGGAEVAGGLMHLSGAAGAGLGGQLGVGLAGQASDALSVLPQVFGIQSTVTGAVTGAIDAGLTGAGSLIAQAGTVILGGKIIQKATDMALPEAIKSAPAKALIPSTKTQALPAFNPAEKLIPVPSEEIALPGAVASAPRLLPSARTPKSKGKKEKISPVLSEEILVPSEEITLPGAVASAPRLLPSVGTPKSKGKKAEIEVYKQTPLNLEVPFESSEILAQAEFLAEKARKAYKDFKEAIIAAQSGAAGMAEKAKALADVLKNTAAAAQEQIQMGREYISDPKLKAQLSNRQSQISRVARAAERTIKTTDFPTIDVTAVSIDNSDDELKSLKSVQDINKSIQNTIQRLRNLATGIQSSEKPIDPAISQKLEQIESEISENLQSRLNALEKQIEVAAIAGTDIDNADKVKNAFNEINAAVSARISELDILAEQIATQIEQDIPIESIPKVARFEAAASRLENQIERQMQNNITLLEPGEAKDSEDFTRLKEAAFERASAYIDAFKQGLAQLGIGIPEIMERSLNTIPALLQKLPAQLDGIVRGLLSNFGRIAIGIGAISVAAMAGPRLIEFGKAASTAALDYERFAQALSFGARGNQSQVQAKIAFAENEIRARGINLQAARNAYSQLVSVTRDTAIEGKPTDELFSAVAGAATVYNLNTEQQDRAFLALSQMASKGVISMEELRQQLGEALPGAMNIAARSMNMTVSEFNKLVGSGQLLAEDFLPKFAKQLQTEFAGSVEEASSNALSAFNRFGNASTKAMEKVGGIALAIAKPLAELGAISIDALIYAFDSLSKILPSVALMLGAIALNAQKAAIAAGLASAKNLILGLSFESISAGAVKASGAVLGLAKQVGVIAARFLLFYAATEAVRFLSRAFEQTKGPIQDFAETSIQNLDRYIEKLKEVQKETAKTSQQLTSQKSNSWLNWVVEQADKGWQQRQNSVLGRWQQEASARSGQAPDWTTAKPSELLSAVLNKEDNDRLSQLGSILTANDTRLSQVLSFRGISGEATGVVKQLKQKDDEIRALQEQRRGIIATQPGNTDALIQIDEKISKISEVRDKLSEPVSLLQQGLASDIEFLKQQQKELPRLAAEAKDESVAQAYRDRLQEVNNRLKATVDAQAKFNTLLQGANALLLQFDTNFSRAIARLTDLDTVSKKIEQTERSALIDQQLANPNLSSTAIARRSAEITRTGAIARQANIERTVKELQQLLDSQNYQQTLKAYGLNENMGAAELEAFANSQLIGEDTAAKNIISKLSELKKLQDSLPEREEEVKNSILAARQAVQADYLFELDKTRADAESVSKRQMAGLQEKLIKESIALTRKTARNEFFSEADQGIAQAELGIKQATITATEVSNQERIVREQMAALESGYQSGTVAGEEYHNRMRDLTNQLSDLRVQKAQALQGIEEATARKIEATNRKLIEQSELAVKAKETEIALTDINARKSIRSDLLKAGLSEENQIKATLAENEIDTATATKTIELIKFEIAEVARLRQAGAINEKTVIERTQELQKRLASENLKLVDLQIAKERAAIDLFNKQVDIRVSKAREASAAIVRGLEQEKAGYDLLNRTIDIQSQKLQAIAGVEQSRAALAQTYSEGVQQDLQNQVGQLNAQLDLLKRINSEEDSGKKRELQKVLNATGASLIGGSEREILLAKQEKEQQIEREKLNALQLQQQLAERQFLLAQKQLEIDLKRAEVAAKIAAIEAQIAYTRQEQSVRQAQGDLEKAIRSRDPEKIREAQINLADQSALLAPLRGQMDLAFQAVQAQSELKQFAIEKLNLEQQAQRVQTANQIRSAQFQINNQAISHAIEQVDQLGRVVNQPIIYPVDQFNPVYSAYSVPPSIYSNNLSNPNGVARIGGANNPAGFQTENSGLSELISVLKSFAKQVTVAATSPRSVTINGSQQPVQDAADFWAKQRKLEIQEAGF